MKEIKNRIVKITGSGDIPFLEMETGADVKILVDASCVKIEFADNQDGTNDVIYKFKIKSLEFYDV